VCQSVATLWPSPAYPLQRESVFTEALSSNGLFRLSGVISQYAVVSLNIFAFRVAANSSEKPYSSVPKLHYLIILNTATWKTLSIFCQSLWSAEWSSSRRRKRNIDFSTDIYSVICSMLRLRNPVRICLVSWEIILFHLVLYVISSVKKTRLIFTYVYR
jgi:hypothetical protein